MGPAVHGQPGAGKAFTGACMILLVCMAASMTGTRVNERLAVRPTVAIRRPIAASGGQRPVYRDIMPRLSPLAHEHGVTGSSRPSGTAQGN
jgi:hypothetical protein